MKKVFLFLLISSFSLFFACNTLPKDDEQVTGFPEPEDFEEPLVIDLFPEDSYNVAKSDKNASTNLPSGAETATNTALSTGTAAGTSTTSAGNTANISTTGSANKTDSSAATKNNSSTAAQNNSTANTTSTNKTAATGNQTTANKTSNTQATANKTAANQTSGNKTTENKTATTSKNLETAPKTTGNQTQPKTGSTNTNRNAAPAKTATQTTKNLTTEPSKSVTEIKPETEENKENEEDKAENKSAAPAPVPSRKVKLNRNETLSVVYPGYGWIYMGSDAEENNLVSTGRKTNDFSTTYTLTAKKSGTQVHHFYKMDYLTGEYIDDYLEVTVEPEKGSVYTIVTAPDYATVVPQKPEKPAKSTATKKAELTDGSILDTEVLPNDKRDFIEYIPENLVRTPDTEVELPAQEQQNPYTEVLNADDLLSTARRLYNEKKYEEAYTCLTAFFEIATSKRDEGLMLKGKVLEADSPKKNIKEAIRAYDTLINSYPESKYWDEANKRVIYLNRFYIEIR